MKKIYTYPVVVLMSVLVFFGGTGMYVPSFCCDTCQSAGIEGIAKGACCEIHHHQHENDSQHADHEPNAASDDDAGCSLSRISYDWMPATSDNLTPEPVFIDLFTIDLPKTQAVSSTYLQAIIYNSSSGPPHHCPRAYLSLLTTLLI